MCMCIFLVKTCKLENKSFGTVCTIAFIFKNKTINIRLLTYHAFMMILSPVKPTTHGRLFCETLLKLQCSRSL